MGQYIEPFDFYTIFVNFFLGNMILLFFALVIILSFAAAKYSMSNRLYLTILAISSVIFGTYIGDAMYILLLIVVGFVTFKAIGKLVQ